MHLHDLFEEAISIKQLHFHRFRHREGQTIVSHKGKTIAKIVTPDWKQSLVFQRSLRYAYEDRDMEITIY